MRSISLLLLALAFSTPAALAADDPQAVFDALYGARVQRVSATPDRADDVALARELLQAGALVEGQPAMIALLCENARKLAENDPSGLSVAVEAMEMLAEHAPDRKAEALDATVDLRTKQFTTARGDERDAVGDALITTLVRAAEARLEAGEADDAVTLYRRALIVGRQIKSSRDEKLRAALDAAQDRHRLSLQMDRLMEQIKSGKGDVPAAAKELVTLIVAELDDPAKASAWTAKTNDAALVKRVGLAEKAVEEVPDDALLDLAEWYRGLALQAVSTLGKRRALSRAAVYLDRYLARHSASDLDGAKAALMKQAVGSALRDAGGPIALNLPNSKPAAPIKPAPPRAGDAQLRPVATFTAGGKADNITVTNASDGRYTTQTVQGRQALVAAGEYLYFTVDESVLHDLPEEPTQNVFVEVTMLDRGRAGTGVNYDSHRVDASSWQGIGHRIAEGTGQWVTFTSELPLARFGDRSGTTANLRLWAKDSLHPFAVHQVRVLTRGLPPVAERRIKPSDTLDLLALVEPKLHTINGEWIKDAKGLHGEPIRFSRIGTPLNIDGSYELEVKFTRDTPSGSVNFSLPVGGRYFTFIIDGYANNAGGPRVCFEYIDGVSPVKSPHVVMGSKITQGKAHTLAIRVDVENGKVDFRAALDGAKLIAWSGDVDQVRGSYWYVSHRGRIGIGAFAGKTHVHSARFHLLDGEALLAAPVTRSAVIEAPRAKDPTPSRTDGKGTFFGIPTE